MTFYHKVVFKVVAPVVIIILLWCYPLYNSMRGRQNAAETMKIKGLAMLLLELTLPSIATSLIKVFVCRQFDNGAFLAEELTLPCDDSKQRMLWITFTTISLVAYVLGGEFLVLFENRSYHSSDCSRCALATVPTLMFTTMYQQRHAIHKLGLELQRHNQVRGTGLTMAQLAKSKHARRSFAALQTEMKWLLPKFEAFTPAQWYASIVLLVIRLIRTSLMALVPSQFVQAIIMCCVTQVAILLQSELSPYRRASDNHVALLSQVLVLSLI